MTGNFVAERIAVCKRRRDALVHELVETVWLAQDQGKNGCDRVRGAIFVKPTLPPHEMAAFRWFVKRMPRSSVVAAAAVLREALDRHAITAQVATKIERHLAGQCWCCGGPHLAVACQMAARAGLRARQYDSGSKKRAHGKGGGQKGKKYKSGARKRAEGTGGGTKGHNRRYKSGARKRSEGTGGGAKRRNSGPKKRKPAMKKAPKKETKRKQKN